VPRGALQRDAVELDAGDACRAFVVDDDAHDEVAPSQAGFEARPVGWEAR
jgi:hypothetical protein